MSYTINPSIDQGALLAFRENFYLLAEQTNSKLANSGAVLYLPSNGKAINMPRIGRLELVEVPSRNPDKAYTDYAIDNRRVNKRRFTRTVTVDQKTDINELIADPSSPIMQRLISAKNRVQDRLIVSAALGDVLVGAPDSAGTLVSAANDGVITVNATGGFTYARLLEIIQHFVNAELDDEYVGATLAITGKEQTNLMNEDEVVNNDYINIKPIPNGKVDDAAGFKVVRFAGSVTGGTQVLSPILPEVTTQRRCVCLAPQAVALSIELGDLSVEKNPTKVNSMDITVDCWIGAMRTEGVRVVRIDTTI